MPRMPLAERRRQLTEAAIRAMTRDGVARTTTRSIAAEANVSLSVFHYCFDSKQALLESVITAITDHYVGRVREALRPRATFRETIRAGFEAYWDHVRAHPGEHMLTYELTQYALRTPGFEPLARRQHERYAEIYQELIEELGASMTFELRVPVPVLARYLAAVTDGLTLNFLVVGQDAAASATILDLITDQVAALAQDGPTGSEASARRSPEGGGGPRP
ncbi:TetR/AcrR family transcriptional regulator [Streptomyces vilmorinianum]|uniref:TetR/AcrR family transcriptional regulator n=1 Tax=Streptomyces vilmorinianum TaxID=3051092 RepID=UPI0010FB18CF|nr:TetR/AcrR family transcriptional regulator [Streptomyces vilmorinianum]